LTLRLPLSLALCLVWIKALVFAEVPEKVRAFVWVGAREEAAPRQTTTPPKPGALVPSRSTLSRNSYHP
jgi:hypothetical protein